nr:MAG TPA: hypothetical protein [Caudoviricetes sp.]
MSLFPRTDMKSWFERKPNAICWSTQPLAS